MSNAMSKMYKTDDLIAFYDIPKIILDLANIKSNAVFLKDMGLKLTPTFIEKKQIMLMLINLKLCKS